MSQFKKKFTHYRAFALPIGVMVVGVLCVIFVFFPAVQRILTMYEEITILREENTKLQKKVNLLTSLDERALDEKFKTTISALPHERSLPTIFQTIEGISDTTGIVVEELTMNDPNALSTQSAAVVEQRDPKTGVIIIPFVVNITGNFEQLSEFLTMSSAVRRLVRAKSFDVAIASDDLVTTTIQFETFFSPLNANPGTAELVDFTAEDNVIVNKIEQFSNFAEPNDSSSAVPPSPEEQKENPFSL